MTILHSSSIFSYLVSSSTEKHASLNSLKSTSSFYKMLELQMRKRIRQNCCCVDLNTGYLDLSSVLNSSCYFCCLLNRLDLESSSLKVSLFKLNSSTTQLSEQSERSFSYSYYEHCYAQTFTENLLYISFWSNLWIYAEGPLYSFWVYLMMTERQCLV